MKPSLLVWSLVLTSVALAAGREDAVLFARNHGKALPAPQTAQALSNLTGLEALVAGAQVVGLGEHDHGLAKETALRKPFFEYLIRQHGFTHLVMESGYLEGDLVDRYVTGDPSVPNYGAAADGMTHSMGILAGNRELIEWMRAYNLDPANAGKPKLRFEGMDITVHGDDLHSVLSSLRPAVGPSLDPWIALSEKGHRLLALCEALVQKATGGKAKHVDPDHLDVINSFGLALLEPEELESLLFFAETLPNRIGASGRERRLALLARQIAADLRLKEALPSFPLKNAFLDSLARVGLDRPEALVDRLSAPGEGRDRAVARFKKRMVKDVLPAGATLFTFYKDYFTARLSRERGLAENLLLTAGAGTKVLVVGADSHLSAGTTDGGYAAGYYVKSALGSRYVTVATAAGELIDESGNPLPLDKFSDHPESLESVLAEAFGRGTYFLGLAGSPDWFRGRSEMRIGPVFYGHWDLTRHYDGVIYFSEETPDERIKP